MKFPDIPSNEKERLDNLESYRLPDLIEQLEFDNLVQLASTICDTPISLITLIDSEKQWFKAKIGLEGEDCTSKDVSFCGHAINTPDDIFVIEDATKDERFSDNPLVTGDPKIVFYAGVPFVTNEGYALGTICVIDRVPRKLDERQLDLLKGLSKQVVRLFELQKTIKLLEEKEIEREQMVNSMCKYVNTIGHDVKMTFRNIQISTELLNKMNDIVGEKLGHIDNVSKLSSEGMHLINQVIKIADSEKRNLEEVDK